jgi:hypothetical protein
MVGGVALTVATLGAAGPVVGAVMVAGLVASTAVDVNDLVAEATGTNFIKDQLLGGSDALYDGLSVATALVGLVGPGGAANLAGKVDDVAEAVTTVTRLDNAGEAVTTTTRAENAVETATTGGRVSDAGGAGSAGGKVDDGFGGGSCLRSFTAATKVLMADGERQPIEDVAVGDQVVSFDPGTGAQSVETVTATWPHADQVVTLTVADGTHVETTASHPWWVESERAYIRTDHLDAGDQLLTSDGASLTVESVSDGQDTQQVYNLTITGPHTYYVGEDTILVHNVTCDFSKPGLDQEMPERGWTRDDVQAMADSEPTGVTRDQRGPSRTPDGVKRDDAATVYGPKPNGYVVVNDRTGEVTQIADRNNPDWIPDGRITWN